MTKLRELMTIELGGGGGGGEREKDIFFLMCLLLNSCLYNVYMYILRASWKISYYMFYFLCMR